MGKLKIPYSLQEVGHCYDQLTQTMPVYQKGIADIRLAMESNNPFEQRMRKVLRLHAMNLQTAETQESSQSSSEEDVYLCCLYDMLESMYAAEAERIVSGAGTYEQKRKNLDEVRASIARLPFGSPQYWNSIRPRLEKAVSEYSKRLEGITW